MSEPIGKTLKKIRESKQLSIEEVSEKTRIPKKIISSIEEDRLHELSSPFYARGFVKSYSHFLGASEEKVVKEYLSGAPEKDTPTLVIKGEKLPGEWFIKYKKYIGAGILVIFSIWVLFFGFLQMKKFVSLFLVKHKTQVTKKQLTKKEEPKEVMKGASLPSKKPSEPSPVTKKKEEALELEVLASYNTWIQVLSDGELLFRGILRKGTKDIWRAKKEIDLELGNAGGVTLKLNGRSLGSPGKRGKKRKVVITKDGIK